MMLSKEEFIRKLLEKPRDLDGVKRFEYNEFEMSDERLFDLAYEKYIRGRLTLD